MPRYFFHVHDGKDMPDDTGTELSSLKEAHEQAVKMSSVLLGEQAGEFWNGHHWSMDVTDDASKVLFTLAFEASVMPSTG